MADVVKEEPVDFDSNWTEDATQIDSSKCDKLPPNEHNNSDEEDVKKDSKFYQVCLTEHWNAGEGTSKQNDGLASTSSTKVKEEKDSENSEMEEDESKSLFEEELHNVEQSMTVEEGDERSMGCDLKKVIEEPADYLVRKGIKERRYRCEYCEFMGVSEIMGKHVEKFHPPSKKHPKQHVESHLKKNECRKFLNESTEEVEEEIFATSESLVLKQPTNKLKKRFEALDKSKEDYFAAFSKHFNDQNRKRVTKRKNSVKKLETLVENSPKNNPNLITTGKSLKLCERSKKISKRIIVKERTASRKRKNVENSAQPKKKIAKSDETSLIQC